MKNKNKPIDNLVSIIMPTYNCGKFISESIDSVLSQTYDNWELIIVDDCSTDNTKEIVKKYQIKDKRIKYKKFSENGGAAMARNYAIDLAKGQYIAFLDSDDLWFPQKLEKQIKFMKDNNYFFTCTNYEHIDEKGDKLNVNIRCENKNDYNGILKKCPGNLTVIYDAQKIGKHKIPNIKKRNDYVMWLKVIKETNYIFGLQETLSLYRIRSNSLSSNKLKLVCYNWQVYRQIEKLSILKSIYLIAYFSLKFFEKKITYKIKAAEKNVS